MGSKGFTLLLGLLLLSAELPSAEAVDRCKLPPDVGLCKARLQKVYYNWGKKRCENFIYGGCFGNLNRFDTETMCLRFCGGLGMPSSEEASWSRRPK